MGQQNRVGLTRNSRARSVHDCHDLRALLASVTDRLDRVHGFTGLRDGHNQCLFGDDRVAVAELRGKLDLDGDTAPVFDRVLGDLTGVGCGTATDHDDLVDTAQDVLGDTDLVECKVSGGINTVFQGFTNAARLLVNFLFHEGRPAVLRRTIRSEVNFVSLERNNIPIMAKNSHATSRDNGHLILIDLDSAVRVLNECQNVRTEEVFAVTQTNDQRRRTACRKNNLRRIG